MSLENPAYLFNQPLVTSGNLYPGYTLESDLTSNLRAAVQTTLLHVKSFGDALADFEAAQSMDRLMDFVSPAERVDQSGAELELGQPAAVAAIDLPVADWSRPGILALARNIGNMFGLTADNLQHHVVRNDPPVTGDKYDVVVHRGQQDPDRPVILLYRPSPGKPDHQQLLVVDGRNVTDPLLLHAVNSLSRAEMDGVDVTLAHWGATPEERWRVLSSDTINRASTDVHLWDALQAARSQDHTRPLGSLALPSVAGRDPSDVLAGLYANNEAT